MIFQHFVKKSFNNLNTGLYFLYSQVHYDGPGEDNDPARLNVNNYAPSPIRTPREAEKRAGQMGWPLVRPSVVKQLDEELNIFN